MTGNIKYLLMFNNQKNFFENNSNTIVNLNLKAGYYLENNPSNIVLF